MNEKIDLLARLTQAPLQNYTETEKARLYESLRRQVLSLAAVIWEICTGEKPPRGQNG